MLFRSMSEPLHLHPPLTYEAVKTELRTLPTFGNPAPPLPPPANIRKGVGITLGTRKVNDSSETGIVTHHTIRNLRPGMILKENIHLSDGVFLMSSGHIFTELSINRLNDLSDLLTKNSIAVQEPSADR